MGSYVNRTRMLAHGEDYNSPTEQSILVEKFTAVLTKAVAISTRGNVARY